MAGAPAFLEVLAGESKENREKLIKATHPIYAERRDRWQAQQDAFEGTGGYATGEYLWQYPREDAADYVKRQSQGRYHNFTETIVDLYLRQVFGQGVKRQCSAADYLAWCDDVDGRGTTLIDILKQLTASALGPGHAGLLIDKSTVEPIGPSKADDAGRVIPTVFPATSILDWRYDSDRLMGVKLREESAPTGLLDVPEKGDDRQPYLLWAEDGWARFDGEATLLTADNPGLDLVPFVVLRVKPSTTSRMVGRALLGDANIQRAIYNRCSEEDEVIRSQAFSVLVVSLPEEANLQEAKDSLGSVIGASKALVVKGNADYKTPSMDTARAIRENVEFLINSLYRAAHVRTPKPSAQVETAEAIKLLNAELNDVLVGVSRALQQAEREICRMWFGWTRATPEQAQADYDAAGFSAQYPSQFMLEDVLAELEEIQAGIDLQLGETMETRLKLRAVKRLDPAIDDKTLEKVTAEIEAVAAAPPDDLGIDPETGEPVMKPGKPPAGAKPEIPAQAA
jgi:hypothetical protein